MFFFSDVDGVLKRVCDDIQLKGGVNAELTLSCSWCLNSFTHLVDANLKACFVPRNHDPDSDREVELYESDIDTEFYKDCQIDEGTTG